MKPNPAPEVAGVDERAGGVKPNPALEVAGVDERAGGVKPNPELDAADWTGLATASDCNSVIISTRAFFIISGLTVTHSTSSEPLGVSFG